LAEPLELFDVGLIALMIIRLIVTPCQPHTMWVVTKAKTCAIEGLNSRIRHYLDRFYRETFRCSKVLHMAKATLALFFADARPLKPETAPVLLRYRG
jgi:hypothetical protein